MPHEAHGINETARQKSALGEGFVERVGALQSLQKESVQAIGAQLAPQFRRQVARLLGGLQSIGALRSGAATAGISRASAQFGEALSTGLAAKVGDQFGTALGLEQLAEQRAARKASEKRGLFGSIGKIGARFLAGTLAGGPLAGLGTVVTGEVAKRLTGGKTEEEDPNADSTFGGNVGVGGRTTFER